MNDSLQNDSGLAPPAASSPSRYRPWSKGRVWAAFFLGMHSAAFMTVFFHPFFSFFAFCLGLPAVILTGMEIRRFPEARMSGPVKWARITGLIGLIGGPVCTVLSAVFWAGLLGLLSRPFR